MIAHMKKLASLANMPLWMGEFGNNQNYWLNPAKTLCEDQANSVNAAGAVVESNFNMPAGWTFWTYKKVGRPKRGSDGRKAVEPTKLFCVR